MAPRKARQPQQGLSPSPHQIEHSRPASASYSPRPAAEVDEPRSQSASLFNGSLTASVGPLPTPEQIEAYERTCPGIARVFLEEFTEQTKHNRKCDLLDRQLHSRGQWMSGMLLTLTLAVTAYAIYAGMQWVAGISCGITAVAVAVYWRRTRPSPAMPWVNASAQLQAVHAQQGTDDESQLSNSQPSGR